ncbi:putative hamus subunit [groundwater metagenome]|uniref:Putative hamus subunit n=1 Tax=groundwater metagenome TaxID=717931 RepID=A0A098EAS5_9ZZZZ
MGKFKKVCATIGGAAIISAAIMGMVSASTTGLDKLDKSFVYDANYNPNVHIVVGEKAAAADVVGAGDIAATIGNLAYTTGACGANGGSAGEVKLAVKSWQMIGKYEQDIKDRVIGTTNLEGSFLSSTFYSTDGQLLANGTLTYTQGMLKNYNIGCQIDKTVSNFPMKVNNCNELCYLCYDICHETKHPDHEMEESIIVDGTKVKYYEDGLGGESRAESLKMKLHHGALQYTVNLGGIPVAAITEGDNLIDSSYRGKMLFMGSNDYFVNNIDKTYIVLAKGEKLMINNAGAIEPTLPELQGYKFKLLRTVQSSGKDAGVVMEIEKPDGTTVQATASKQAGASLGTDAKGHKIQIQAFQVTGNEASIIAYDMSTQYRLEHNKKPDGWRVIIEPKKCNDVKVDDYGTPALSIGNALNKWCLTKLTLTQEDAQTLNIGDTVYFPTKAVKFSFEGFKDEDFGELTCSGRSDKIKIETSDNRKVMLSFTARDGERLNNVRLDEGAYELDELFLIGNTVYKFRGTEDITNDVNNVKLLLTDVSNANDFEVTLTKLNGSFSGFNYTYFDKYSTSMENSCTSCSIFNGTVQQIPGKMAYFHENKLWIDAGTDSKIGLNNIALTDIQNDNCQAKLTTLFENGSNLNGETTNNNSDDQILVFEGCGEDRTYIDFYDTNRKARGTGDYQTSVKITGTDTSPVANTSCLGSGIVCHNSTSLGFEGVLKYSEDTKLWSPRGADLFTVTNYGSDKQVKAVEICHPTKKTYVTYFLGKEKTESEQLGTITADDVGKLKTIGCCEATVKSFGLSAGNATNTTGTCTNMKPVGTLMVLDKNAVTGNLIVVGGPSVNTLAASAGVTKEEIGADANKYVIKMVGNNTLVVAGWEAEDTNKATGIVVQWLLANAHNA